MNKYEKIFVAANVVAIGVTVVHITQLIREIKKIDREIELMEQDTLDLDVSSTIIQNAKELMLQRINQGEFRTPGALGKALREEIDFQIIAARNEK